MDLLQTLEVIQKRTRDTPSTLHPDVLPNISPDAIQTPKSLTADIYLMVKCCNMKRIFFTHVKGLLYKYIMDSGKQFLALIILKSWKYTVMVEAHDNLCPQGNSCTYCLKRLLLEGNEQRY